MQFVNKLLRTVFFTIMVSFFLMILWVYVLDIPVITHKVSQPLVKISNDKAINGIKLDIEVMRQYPELPRGCEVTSLAMLLSAAGVEVDKLDLAKQVKKDPTPFKRVNSQTYFGNPNSGFVGDMYNLNKPGFGVYHEPIAELAEHYLPNRIVDLSGNSFDKVISNLKEGVPVWAIVNTEFKKLPDSYFQEWQTPSGKIKVTSKEHAILITGYDPQFVYVNDPLTGKKNMPIEKQAFISSWEQMGKQAISFTN